MDNVQLLVYQAEHENVTVDVVLKGDTMWATQKAMANLFQVQIPAISKHIKHIFEEGELSSDTTISKMETVVNHSSKDHMGLTTWKNAPDGRVLKSDVSIAKNYLDVQTIRRLERVVSGYFDYIEDLIENENTFTMEQFVASVTEFLQFRKFQILPNEYKGLISHEEAQQKAEMEYDKFNRTQYIESDFDKAIKQLELFDKTTKKSTR